MFFVSACQGSPLIFPLSILYLFGYDRGLWSVFITGSISSLLHPMILPASLVAALGLRVEKIHTLEILFLPYLTARYLVISATVRKYPQKPVSAIIPSSLSSLLRTSAGGLLPYLHSRPFL